MAIDKKKAKKVEEKAKEFIKEKIDVMNESILPMTGASAQTPAHVLSPEEKQKLNAALFEEMEHLNACLYNGWFDKVNTKKIENLISQGADVNAKDENGGTPLHYAAEHFHLKDGNEENTVGVCFHFGPFKLLIEKGADAKAKNKEGKTPLDFVANKFKPGTDIKKLLGTKMDVSKLK